MNRSVVSLLLLGTIVLFCATWAWGQTETGQITGTVTDPSGAVVPNATISAKSLNTGETRTATTSTSGNYVLPNLRLGTYEVTISAPGFANVVNRVQVTVAGRHTLDAHMAVQSAGTTVEVIGQGGVEVNTETQQLSQLVTSAQVVGLPTLTRNPYDLVLTAGNVAEPDVQNRSGGPANVRGAGASINGQREASTNILLDGGENVDLFTASVGQTVPLDSVQEFRVINGDFTAEYGRAAGGVVNVATKSGTNNVHGTIYEFNRISTLASNTYDNAAKGAEKGRFTRNQFGVSLGGPVVRDKLFFFGSGEGTLVRSSAKQINLVPTPEFIAASAPATQAVFQQQGQLSAPITQSFTAADLGITPGPRLAALGNLPILGQVIYDVPADAGGGNPQDTYNIVGRVDYNATPSTTVFGRYSLLSTNGFPGTNAFSPYAGFNTGFTIFNNNAMASLTHVWSPKVISTTKLLFNRLNQNQPLGPAGIVPSFYFQDGVQTLLTSPVALPGYLPFTPGLAIPFGGPQNQGQIYQDLSWIRGNHSIKFGGQYIYTQDNRTFGAFESAVESFGANGQLPQAFDNFLSGQLFRFQTAVDPQGKFPCLVVGGTVQQTPGCTVNLPASQPNFSRSNRYHDFSIYTQDSWKIHPRLTLNLGVRWEYYGVQHNKDEALDSNFYFGPGSNIFEQIRNGQVFTVPNAPIDPKALWEPDYNNVAPRIGFALDVFGDGRTSLRGGYGIAYERNFGNVTFNVIQNPPNYAVVFATQGDPEFPTIPVSANNLGPLGAASGTVPLPRTSLRHVRQDIGTAYSHLWSLSGQRELTRNTVFELAYSGSRGIHLYSIENTNRRGEGVLYLGDDPALGNTRLNQQYTGINTRGKAGFSYYNALNVSLRTANFRDTGLQLTANYTWSHAIDNLSTTFSENTNNFNLGLLDPFNPSSDKGDADFDMRHRFVLSGVYPIPMFKDQPGVIGHILGGWEVAPIFEVHTGYPFSIWDSTNILGDGVPRWDPGTNNITRTVTSNPNAVGPNSFNLLPFPTSGGSVVGAGNPSLINPVLGISDFGPSCTTPGSGASSPCTYPATMTHRNSFRGPGFWNLNLGAYKNFKVTERTSLQFRGEMFNIFNHHNFYVNGSLADVNGATFIEGKKGGLGNPFDERRNVQLAVKLIF